VPWKFLLVALSVGGMIESIVVRHGAALLVKLHRGATIAVARRREAGTFVVRCVLLARLRLTGDARHESLVG
jgi:hypothetical protein